jgi:NADPH:quinone reductase
MPKAILLEQPGGPENLKWKDIPDPKPGAGEVVLKQTVVGVNFIDVYHRSGLYTLPNYPAIIGMEAVGVITELGEGCEGLSVGDRVGYGVGPMGAYTQARAIPAEKVVKIPDTVVSEIAAAMMLKGLTAYFLVRRTFIAGPDHTVLVHAAAGGVGLLLCQLAKLLGARVIGTVGSEEKAALAAANGCDFTILYKKEDVVKRVKEITGGEGVNAVYDAVGKDTIGISLDCLMRFGILVSYGQASGPVPPIDPLELSRRGSLFFTRPSLMHYMEKTEDYQRSLSELFDILARGLLKVNVGQSYYLSDAVSAHRDLEAGKTTGSTIMITGV